MVSCFSFSQEFQGKAYYMSKVSVDKSFLDNPRAAQWKGYMEKMLKQNTEKDYVLNFNSTESIYREIEKLDIEDGRGGFNWMAQYIGENIGKLVVERDDNMEFFGGRYQSQSPICMNSFNIFGLRIS